jgi:hypothetical protein
MPRIDEGDRRLEGLMIRPRAFGSDVPFCEWLRSQEQQLPSWSVNKGIVATDVDILVHRYFTGVSDKEGTREIQSMMLIEVKTRGGIPRPSQRDTARKHHLSIKRSTNVDGQVLYHFGVYFLQLSNTTPDDSSMKWGKFSDAKGSPEITWKGICKEDLFDLLLFKIHPTSFASRPFRRHHASKEIVEVVKTPLGFTVDQITKNRS